MRILCHFLKIACVLLTHIDSQNVGVYLEIHALVLFFNHYIQLKRQIKICAIILGLFIVKLQSACMAAGQALILPIPWLYKWRPPGQQSPSWSARQLYRVRSRRRSVPSTDRATFPSLFDFQLQNTMYRRRTQQVEEALENSFTHTIIYAAGYA